MGGGTNYVLGDEGKVEVLTDGSGTTVVRSLNASAGGTDDIDIGAGFNVVIAGAASDSIDVTGTAGSAKSSRRSRNDSMRIAR